MKNVLLKRLIVKLRIIKNSCSSIYTKIFDFLVLLLLIFNIKFLKKLCFILVLFSTIANASSFSKSKKLLEQYVYNTPEMRQTIYCNVSFNADKTINLPPNIIITKYKNRMHRIEWEHIVPQSILPNKIAKADIYNLYPAIGSVNAARSNYEFIYLKETPTTFGACQMKIKNRKAEPPNYAKGNVARAYLYMTNKYSDFTLSDKQIKMFEKWSKLDPVDKSECLRTRQIQIIQGNENKTIKKLCKESFLWF